MLCDCSFALFVNLFKHLFVNEYSFINNNKPLLPLYLLAIRLTSVNAYIYEFLDKSFEKVYTE